MRTSQFITLLVVVTWAAISISRDSSPTPVSPPSEALQTKQNTPNSDMSSLLGEALRDAEAHQQEFTARLKQPEPDEAFKEMLKCKTFSIFAEPRDQKAAAELRFRGWEGSAVVVANPKTGIPTVISSAHLMVTHDQSAFIEQNFGDVIRTMNIKPTWRDPDERLAVRLRDYRGQEFPCLLLRANPQTDVVAFTVNQWQAFAPETITTSIGRADEGEWVVLCDSVDSTPHAQCARLGDFHFSLQTNAGTVINQLEVAIPLRHGASGGPVFNTRGELIGICSSSNSKTHSHFTHWSSIERLLDE